MQLFRKINAFILVLTMLLSYFVICPEIAMQEVSAASVDVVAGTELIDLHTQWRYLDNGTDPAAGGVRTSWTTADFDDSAWKTNGSKRATAPAGQRQTLMTAAGRPTQVKMRNLVR